MAALEAQRQQLQEERRWLQDALQSRWMREAAEHASTVRVHVDVGGQVFAVPASVLRREPESVLAKIAEDLIEEAANEGSSRGAGKEDDDNDAVATASAGESSQGSKPGSVANPVFFDRDWWAFRHVLQWLREGEVALPATKDGLKLVYQEARFFGLRRLREAVRTAFQRIAAAEAELDGAFVGASPIAADPALVGARDE
jgi:hypothetical protein